MSGEQYTQMDAGDGNARDRGGSRRQLAMLTVVSGAFLVLAVVLLAVVIVGRGDSSSVEVGSKATPKTARSSLEGSTTTAVPDDQGARGALADVDLSGIDIAVGSKDFDEQLILGHLLAEAFEASGANVERQINLGGTNVTRSALLSGEIDSYAEYNGTGWTEHLKQEDPPSDGEELTEKVREMDGRENDIAWGVGHRSTMPTDSQPVEG